MSSPVVTACADSSTIHPSQYPMVETDGIDLHRPPLLCSSPLPHVNPPAFPAGESSIFPEEDFSSDVSMLSPDSLDSISCTLDISLLSSGPSRSLVNPMPPSTETASPSSDSTLSAHSDLPNLSVNAGFKLVFDNVDKSVKPRHMTLESQKKLLQCVQAYAVKDRVDYSKLSDHRDPVQLGECHLYDILPSSTDYEALKQRFTTHVSRIIVNYLGFFKDDFKNLVPSHLPHKYSSEMCQKSEVVSSYTYHFLCICALSQLVY